MVVPAGCSVPALHGAASFPARPATKSERWQDFPLLGPSVARKEPGALRYAAQRHARHAARQRLAIEAVSALNHLAAVKVLKSAPRRTDPGPGRPTALQSDMLSDITCRITAAGRPPDDLDEQGALAELLASKDFYSEVPHSLADYDPTTLRVSKGDVVPKDAVPLLPAEAAGYLRHSRKQIERSPEDIEQRATVLGSDSQERSLRDMTSFGTCTSQHIQLSEIDQGSSGLVFRAQEG